MPRAKNTREKIERAALELFVRQGITETKTRQIADGAGISEGAIYRHFESKDVLARELLQRIHVGLAESVRDAAASVDGINAKARAVVETYCARADADWLLFAYHLLAQQALLRYFEPGLLNPVDVVTEIVREAMARREIPARDPSLVAGMALGVVLQPATFMVYGRLAQPLSAYSEDFVRGVVAVLHNSLGDAE